MPEWIAWTLGIIFFLIAISISVGLHEAGHMSVAKMFKIPVPKFFVGFGPTIWSRKGKNTEYGLKALPLGGFVIIEDDTQPKGSVERNMLTFVKPWKRILVFLAGPAVNLVLGTFILVTVLMNVPMQVVGQTIESVDKCATESTCAADQAGLLAGDKLIKLDGRVIESVEDFSGRFLATGSELVILRDGVEKTINVTGNKDGRIGVMMMYEYHDRGLVESVSTIGTLFKMNAQAIIQVPSKIPNIIQSILGNEERSQDSVSSIIGIGRVYGDTVAETEEQYVPKFATLMMYTGMLNLGLGFANLLPILPLDGGRILIAVMDSARMRWASLRKKIYTPTPYKWAYAMTIVGGVVLFSFMLLVAVADVLVPVSI